MPQKLNSSIYQLDTTPAAHRLRYPQAWGSLSPPCRGPRTPPPTARGHGTPDKNAAGDEDGRCLKKNVSPRRAPG
ncbi:hypothetical protein E2C01_100604 [Portunus trituberculatus]|uniref:Uncharacterized protein n=1 Tax=Portunus trituberculatus TaxID=210409 RepID=A0A5B7K8H0_PORTR|nr:hypothetical protein [Portunus trituberculatus]